MLFTWFDMFSSKPYTILSSFCCKSTLNLNLPYKIRMPKLGNCTLFSLLALALILSSSQVCGHIMTSSWQWVRFFYSLVASTIILWMYFEDFFYLPMYVLFCTAFYAKDIHNSFWQVTSYYCLSCSMQNNRCTTAPN